MSAKYVNRHTLPDLEYTLTIRFIMVLLTNFVNVRFVGNLMGASVDSEFTNSVIHLAKHLNVPCVKKVININTT